MYINENNLSEDRITDMTRNIITQDTNDIDVIYARKKLLRFWPKEPSKEEIERSKEQIKRHQKQLRYQEETKKRWEEKSKRKPLMEGKTQKEKTALIMKLRKR